MTGEGAAMNRGGWLFVVHANGYTDDESERERLTHDSVMVPLTVEQNVGQMRAAGLVDVECSWRALNFGGSIAVKR